MDQNRQARPHRHTQASPDRAHGFPPLIGTGPTVLILGTLPGLASIAAGEYYAHPRNAFWPILAHTVGFASDLPYGERTLAATEAGIAVWDVLQSADRPGSLDSNIRAPHPNDVARLLETRDSIAAVVFNGKGAQKLFHRHVAPVLADRIRSFTTIAMPSTSPALTMAYERKRAAWHTALSPYVRLRQAPTGRA